MQKKKLGDIDKPTTVSKRCASKIANGAAKKAYEFTKQKVKY